MRTAFLSVFISLLLAPCLLPAHPRRIAPKVDYKAMGAPLPPFRIARMDSSALLYTEVKPGKPTVLMIFSPTCDHCEKVMDTLKMHTAEFSNAQWIFVAEGIQREHMRGFISRIGISKMPFFKNIGTDWSNLIYYTYRQEMLPQVNVYNSQGKLAHTFTTHIPLDSVKLFLR